MIKRIPIFLSVGHTHNVTQRKYLDALVLYLRRNGISAETLGETFWSIQAPLIPIQHKMLEVYGAAILAMERSHLIRGVYEQGSPSERTVVDQYYATVWNHIEAAMAYQLKLPLLILKEEKLVAEGMFDPGIHEWLIVQIKPNNPYELKLNPIKGFINSWIEAVKKYYYTKKGSMS